VGKPMTSLYVSGRNKRHLQKFSLTTAPTLIRAPFVTNSRACPGRPHKPINGNDSVNTDNDEKTTTLMAELPPVAEHIFAPSKEGFELVGAYCDNCEKYFFPIREHCSLCLGKTLQTRLGSSGVVYSFTVIRTRPPFGLPQPYGVAYIDLDGFPLRVFALLDPAQLGKVHIGASVRLSVGAMGVNNDDQSCLRPFFQLLSTASEH